MKTGLDNIAIAFKQEGIREERARNASKVPLWSGVYEIVPKKRK